MAKSVLFPLLILLLILTTTYASAPSPGRMGLKMVRRSLSSQSYSELQSFYYSQTLDHFNYRPDSYQTFQQRYFINSQYWGGANTSSPIFAYLGAETDVTLNIPAIGFIDDLAARFKGLLLYMEVSKLYQIFISLAIDSDNHVR